MSDRIVVLGWEGRALELSSPEAELLVKHGHCRVTLTRWGGDLSDATVLMPLGPMNREDQLSIWDRILRVSTGGREYRIPSAEVQR